MSHLSISPPISPLPAYLPLLALGLGACVDSGSSAGLVPDPTVTNLGLVTQSSELAVDGEHMLVAAREFEAGGQDLNLDGDSFDEIVYLVDLEDGSARNTGLALEVEAPTLLAAVRGRLAIFAASERASGARDLNGDGDTDDAVPFVQDARDGTLRGLAVALSLASGASLALAGERAALVVSEAGQGTDLDGDGDTADDILHVYDSRTRSLANTGLDAPSPLFFADEQIAFFLGETALDRNGDGDTDDRAVLQVFDVSTGSSRSSALATDGAPPVFAAGTWLVGVPEAAQRRDLDGDGERASTVVHAFEPATGLVRNLGVACVDSPCAEAAPGRLQPVFALRVAEAGRVDLNGDGDRLDLVPQLYDPVSARLRNTGVASAAAPVFADGVLAFLASEAGQGTDLDGDGDRLDAVATVASLATGAPSNVGQEALVLRGSNAFLLLARRESAAGIDWNEDGDREDVVVHVFDPRRRRTFNTGIASADVFGASASEVLLFADEAGQGADLNLDGDRSDQVFVLYDLARQRATSLDLAGGLDGGRFGSLDNGGRFALLANELAQGRDLNGDGDLLDDVLHRGR